MSGLQGGQYQSVISQIQPFQLFLCPPFDCIRRGYDLERHLWRSMAVLWLFMSKFVPYKIINMLTLSSFCRGLSAYWVLFYNFLEKLTGSKAIMDEARTMAKIQFTSDEYFLPSVMPGNSFNWAIMNDFSLITQKTGLNYADFIKVFNEFKMENYQAKVKFSPSKNLNSETLKKQDEWQKFAQFGLPTGQLYDYSRNQKVDFNFWEVKSEEKRERDRLWAERMRQQNIENANNSYVISSENAKVNLNVHLDENKSEIINIYTRDNDDKGCCTFLEYTGMKPIIQEVIY